VAACAASELLEGAAPTVAGASALGVWLLDGLYRELLRFSA
jgi:hypothetical protein